MPKEVENKLRREAMRRRLKGKKADSYVYGTMNKMGLMHGNKADYSQTSKKEAMRKVSKMTKED